MKNKNRKLKREIVYNGGGCYKFFLGFNTKTNKKVWLSLPYWKSYDVVNDEGHDDIEWDFTPLKITNLSVGENGFEATDLCPLLEASPYTRPQIKKIGRLTKDLIEQGEKYDVDTYYDLVEVLLGDSVLADLKRVAEFCEEVK